jgi:hypothetical protein
MDSYSWHSRVKVKVFNATFNNISVILWRSVLLVEKTIDLPLVTDKLQERPPSYQATFSRGVALQEQDYSYFVIL